jgi:calcineurin-like phosphoesterase family protein
MINYKLEFDRGGGSPEHFFISDLHYNHNKDFIWGARGRQYKNVHEMNEDILHQWNSHVTTEDIVWHLGDMIFNDWSGVDCLALYEKLNFKVLYEFWGNHRSGTKSIYSELCKEMGLEDGKEQYPMELKLSENKTVIYLGHYAEAKIDGQRIIISHYPFESWWRASRGAWMLHGHCHCNLENTRKVKRLDVGWDQLRKPIDFPTVRKLMNGLIMPYEDKNAH